MKTVKDMGGILIYFTSYSNLEQCFMAWSESKCLEYDDAVIFKEEKDHKSLMESYDAYVNHINKGT
jgi:Rad3-related DNA helicase